MNFSKLFGALALSSFAIVAGCAAETSAPGSESVASEQAAAKSCTGLSTTTCEATRGCMEEDTSCLVSCTVGAGCAQHCTTACAPLACSSLSVNDCSTYSGNQCQLDKSCLVNCTPGVGCSTTCTDSCVPTVVNCANLDQSDCAANGNYCTSVPGSCVETCTVNGRCTSKCSPATCAPISN